MTGEGMDREKVVALFWFRVSWTPGNLGQRTGPQLPSFGEEIRSVTCVLGKVGESELLYHDNSRGKVSPSRFRVSPSQPRTLVCRSSLFNLKSD